MILERLYHMENSKILLQYALHALAEAGLPENAWAIGGGTVLAHTYHHRLSKDIDIFINDRQWLSSLSPRVNDASDTALFYDEESQYISLTFPEGKVDFIACPLLTTYAPQQALFLEQYVLLDHPIEIVCKKIYYRGNQVMPRDVFDLAIVFDSPHKNDLIKAITEFPEQFIIFRNAFKAKQKDSSFILYSREFSDMILPGGKHMQYREYDVCNELINEVDKKVR